MPIEGSDVELRRAAIRNIRAVYSRAIRLLVLDASLIDIPGTLKSSTPQEILARIAASKWMRRYWTLVEGLLAKTVYFQFGECALKIGNETGRSENYDSYFFDDEISHHVDSTDLRIKQNARLLPYWQRVASVWTALRNRIAGVKADETICVATLLDMDLEPLLEVGHESGSRSLVEERMRRLWAMYEEFPLGVLCRPAEKLDDPTQPWAFAHMEDCIKLVPPTLKAASVKGKTLSFSHHGLILKTPLKRRPSSVIRIHIEGEVYFIRQNLKNRNAAWAKEQFDSSTEVLGVILGQDDPEPVTACLGALVSVSGHVDEMNINVLEGRYLRSVSLIKQGSAFDYRSNPPWTAIEELEKEFVQYAQWTHQEQIWKIRGNHVGVENMPEAATETHVFQTARPATTTLHSDHVVQRYVAPSPASSEYSSGDEDRELSAFAVSHNLMRQQKYLSTLPDYMDGSRESSRSRNMSALQISATDDKAQVINSDCPLWTLSEESYRSLWQKLESAGRDLANSRNGRKLKRLEVSLQQWRLLFCVFTACNLNALANSAVF